MVLSYTFGSFTLKLMCLEIKLLLIKYRLHDNASGRNFSTPDSSRANDSRLLHKKYYIMWANHYITLLFEGGLETGLFCGDMFQVSGVNKIRSLE